RIEHLVSGMRKTVGADLSCEETLQPFRAGFIGARIEINGAGDVRQGSPPLSRLSKAIIHLRASRNAVENRADRRTNHSGCSFFRTEGGPVQNAEGRVLFVETLSPWVDCIRSLDTRSYEQFTSDLSHGRFPRTRQDVFPSEKRCVANRDVPNAHRDATKL